MTVLQRVYNLINSMEKLLILVPQDITVLDYDSELEQFSLRIVNGPQPGMSKRRVDTIKKVITDEFEDLEVKIETVPILPEKEGKVTAIKCSISKKDKTADL